MTAMSLVSVQLLVGSFMVYLSLAHALSDDVRCLKSIKASLEDPNGYLKSSWSFDNYTEGFICQFTGVDCWHPDENKVLGLNLSGMRLEGNFPTDIKYCTSLTGLNLSNNALSGPIPSDIDSLLPFTTSLDLSYNNFSGEIPNRLINCTYLNILRLDHNRLGGTFPIALASLPRLRTFSVADNYLSGQVPFFDSKNFTEESFANNLNLCGGPLEPCNKDRKDTFKLGFGIGFAVSFLVAVVRASSVSAAQVKSLAWTSVLSVVMRKTQDLRPMHLSISDNLIEILGLGNLFNRISICELCSATDNFRQGNVIGTGKTGTMYKATLRSGCLVAVKRLNNDYEQFESQVVTELLALGRLTHDNIAPLFGFCLERNERLLVYKYMSNGSLHDSLRSEGNKILEWPTRVKIAVGVSRGLSWLHHECNFRVVHRDITSKCVLLDDHFEPKLSNFGKSIVTNRGAVMVEYANESEDSGLIMTSEKWESDFVKRDVFDYGIVLLELLGIPKATVSDMADSSTASSLDNPSPCIVDKRLSGQGFDSEILEVLEIAYECLRVFPHLRPTMLQVYTRISSLGERCANSADEKLSVD